MNIKEEFIIRFAPDAVKVARATGFPPDALLAHAALETGWGRHVPANNLFGIKDLTWDPGKIEIETKEAEGMKLLNIIAPFEDFESPLDSMICYIGLLRTYQRYRKAWHHAMRKEIVEFFRALQDGGYATDPMYASKLIAVWKSLPRNWLEIAACLLYTSPSPRD